MNANQESIESDEETLSKMCDRAEKGGRISECPNVRISHKILFTIISSIQNEFEITPLIKISRLLEEARTNVRLYS